MLSSMATVVQPEGAKSTRAREFNAFLVTIGVAQCFAVATPAHADETWAAVRQSGELRCGAAVSAPVVLRDVRTGQVSGPFADLCKKFGEQVLRVKVTFVDTTWDNMVTGVQTGKWDIAMALNRTPEREQSIAFSAPVVQSVTNLVYARGNPKLAEKPKSLDDIDKPDITIADIQGTANDKEISKVIKHAKLIRLPEADAARLALLSRRADILADTSESNAIFHAAHPDTTLVFEPQVGFAKEDMSFGLNKQTSAADLSTFNQFIVGEQKSGFVKASFDAAAKQSVQGAK